jgi:hypothetical protein
MQVAITTTDLAAAAILRTANANQNITPESLVDEIERGAIEGWTAIVQRYSLTFSQWTGAMERAAHLVERRNAKAAATY